MSRNTAVFLAIFDFASLEISQFRLESRFLDEF